MHRRRVFADPKTDFAFYRIFGTEKHKIALLGFLNDILQLDDAHRITDVKIIDPAQRPKVEELKRSIVDVKCTDVRGVHFVVEMQVLNVEAFGKRVVYNVTKAYTNQLEDGDEYPRLNDIVGITICDFELWPDRECFQPVPMLSRWRMQEQSSGQVGLLALQFVFLELPKYNRKDPPATMVDKWAYFFREARSLELVPEALQHPPLLEAFEAARTSTFTKEEWDAYIEAGMAIQNERGLLSLAEEKGIEKGIEQGRATELRQAVRDLCEVLSIALTEENNAQIEQLEVNDLVALRDRIKQTRAWA